MLYCDNTERLGLTYVREALQKTTVQYSSFFSTAETRLQCLTPVLLFMLLLFVSYSSAILWHYSAFDIYLRMWSVAKDNGAVLLAFFLHERHAYSVHDQLHQSHSMLMHIIKKLCIYTSISFDVDAE